MRRLRDRGAAGVLLVLTLTTGCGGGTPPAADDVPALADALARVETTVASQRYPAARSALEALVEDTTAAREAGDLSGEQAAAVLAADALLEALPGEEPEPEEEAPASEEPEPAPLEQSPPLTDLPFPEATDDPGESDESGDDEKPGKPEKPDKPEKDQKPDKPDRDDDD